ncbi:MAG TPA: methyltransferase domain-containing protein [Chloroflexota bacterium]|nr:methyltransferase domain-containing protein [Chloroflexota bacterium]
MAGWLERVRAWYDRDPELEWRRLEGRVQYRIEHLVTLHALGRHLPPPGDGVRVLDAGGGPGRYTVALAARGYTMTLLDLSPGNVALARRKVAAAGPAVARRVEECIEGTFTDLSSFADGRFDAVLCLGAAFSHLIDPSARRRALAELQRVARPGAPLFVSALNRIASYRGVVQWPHTWEEGFPAGLASFAATGYSDAGDWPSYAFMPEELVALIEGAGLEPLVLYGAQGIAAHLPSEGLAALMADPQRWPIWRELLLATCDHPTVVGVSTHLLAVARAHPRQG